MKLTDSMRAVQGISDVVMPDDLAIGRIQKRNSIPPKVEWAAGGTFGIPLGLCQNALRPKSQLLWLRQFLESDRLRSARSRLGHSLSQILQQRNARRK